MQRAATTGATNGMNSSDRTGLYQGLLTTFLARAKDRGYIVIGVLGRADEYVQFIIHGDQVGGEVGSRQWTEPERPLPEAAVKALGGLGFVGGGPERNFARDGLPRSAAKLAKLTDTRLRAAYDLDEDFSPVVHEIHLNDVTPPRAEPFTRAMIEAHFLSPGINPRSLFDTFTERTVGSMIEFWTPTTAGGDGPEGRGGEEPSRRRDTDDGSEP